MKREIKFRVRKTTGEWAYFGLDDLIRHASNVPSWVCENPSLKKEQFIGLKDKNGNEIYEGDIVGVKNKTFTYKAVIALGWSDDGEYGWCQKRDGLSTIIRTVDYVDERYEIFGNIYENPDEAKQIVKKPSLYY
jgi:YopX protein